MAQSSTLPGTLADSFREVAAFFDRFPAITGELKYPKAPAVVHFIVARAEQVEALAHMFDATPRRSVDPITGDTTVTFTIGFGMVELVAVATEPMVRELRRPLDITESLAERDL